MLWVGGIERLYRLQFPDCPVIPCFHRQFEYLLVAQSLRPAPYGSCCCGDERMEGLGVDLQRLESKTAPPRMPPEEDPLLIETLPQKVGEF
jgi:hypothetical protein